MANIVTRPLSIFRKHDSSKPQSQPQSHSLHTRWGDATISAPTDGSWTQYTTSTPPQSSSSTRRSKSKSKSTDKPAYEVEYVPRTHQLIESRPSSTLTPTSTTSTSTSTSLSRRLSIRLAPRSRSSRSDCDTTERQPLVERRAQFAYKPIRQDYPSEVAEKTAAAPRITVNSVDERSISPSPSPASSLEPTPSPSWSRFRYIPAYPRYEEEFARSRSSRAYSVSSSGSYRAGDDENWDEGFNLDSGSGSRRSGSSAKKRVAARRMTMTMVPDADEIYG
ncbi:uncharacterized protein NFIA_107740 [Aspergillus fischeri NRRL 181]|uniref:Uncharacterized protein n=1 Tax=Neosartorya fischeri (strain ATCC 1020 / DSM 3700 / CBS 544.65 / FGSC A1164 / JCM 1740 / NRRL 181 / WB 181) TaxID=331117 RepID=A1CXD0_NEOFI|nr:conserved hypothetical protein [Aspergillus fischeri NRRL 181]EAW25282.1 conserved hypothetical protein [Aspergillus fischeri NRRL 181]KAG2026935.1 hypothetical protein GB937_000671 [Aspergillus fischeri]